MGLTIDKCIEGWTNSLKQLKVKADIVFFGDSLTYYGDFSSVFPDKVVCNLGLRGDTLEGLINRIEQVRVVQPEKIFLMAGINDAATCQVDEFQERYEDLLTTLKEQLPLAEIIVQSLFPVNDEDYSISCTNAQIEECNEKIEKLCSIHKLEYLDLYGLYSEKGRLAKDMTDDGIHLRRSAYIRWYDRLKTI